MTHVIPDSIGTTSVQSWTLDILEGRIQTTRSVINPGKLVHLGPVAYAWAIAREANQTRRPQIDRKC